jgi:hypothetical protein
MSSPFDTTGPSLSGKFFNRLASATANAAKARKQGGWSEPINQLMGISHKNDERLLQQRRDKLLETSRFSVFSKAGDLAPNPRKSRKTATVSS